MIFPIFFGGGGGGGWSPPKCVHCGKEYPSGRGKERIGNWILDHPAKSIPLAVFLSLYVMFTALTWLMPFDSNPTLVGIFREQAAYVWALLHRIW